MIDTKEFKEMCEQVANAEGTINFHKKCIRDIDNNIKELGNKETLSRENNLAYLLYKEERKKLGIKIKECKDFKKEVSRKISEYERNYVKGSDTCYRVEKCEYIKFNGNNIEDVFKFSHSTSYTFNDDQLLIYGRKDICINIGEILVSTSNGYEVYTENEFENTFVNNVKFHCDCECCCEY